MQFLGPALNGMKAYGCRPMDCSIVNRSGLKVSGSSKIRGFRCSAYDDMTILQPSGIRKFPVN